MSIIISFAVVFVFTRFVFASYVIPTGSMAPTLMGAHMRFYSEDTGVNWPVNPWEYANVAGRGVPVPVQKGPIFARDPITNLPSNERNVPVHAGDRIFVLKYLYTLSEPSRFDVVVFKFPGASHENYIKRLIGLPGEELWIADGDIFTRKPNAASEADKKWRIQRKPRRIQRDVWYTLYSSELRPLTLERDGRAWWRDRWAGQGWEGDGRSYTHQSKDRAELSWNSGAREIDDWVAYNDIELQNGRRFRPPFRFPISDVRMRASVTPKAEGLQLIAEIIARGYEFRALLDGDQASIQMRAERRGQMLEWNTLTTTNTQPLTIGKATSIELWHYDQRLELWMNGRRVATAEYEWSPEERLANALKLGASASANVANPSAYKQTRIRWIVEGAPVTLQRVGLDRDLYLQPNNNTLPARGVGPDNTFELGEDQFFLCGDNSGASLDARLWDSIDPWVESQIDDRVGVVNRELMMGKAFFVFFPGSHGAVAARELPVPDFGRMRMIR